MKNQTTNTFHGGLNQDSPAIQTPNNVYTYLENGTFITHEGNELILQNEKGTLQRASIKEGYIPLAIKSYGNIAYIVSGEGEYFTTAIDEGNIYNNSFPQHFVDIVAGSYLVTIDLEDKGTDENPDTTATLITISTNVKGTIFSEEVSVGNSKQFTITVDEIDKLITNKAGYNYTLTITKQGNKQVYRRLTGRGEIGTFPSPDYYNSTSVNSSTRTCGIINEYVPFLNYLGDNDISINSPSYSQHGEFNSIFFNFKDEYPVEIVAVQPSYDGSINVIFTDGFNRPKLINSRFSVINKNTVNIIDRTGSNDDNLYSADNFNNTLNHILTTNKIPNVEFTEQTRDGQLISGTYKYFFALSTQDDNVTDILAETFDIPVFIGNSVSTTRMSTNNESTDKSNIITLTNIDTAYDSVKVYFTFSKGQGGVDASTEYLTLPDNIQITDSTVTIKHTGFEEAQVVSRQEINLISQTIFTYNTGTELKSRLFVGNIKSRVYDQSVLRDYAASIQIYTGSKRLNIKGLDNDSSHQSIFSDINYNGQSFDGFEGGYYNPKNVHDYLGYWGGETYMFSGEFLFNDGTSSPLFPVRGLDNFDGTGAYTNNTLSSDQDFDSTTGENIRGIYRFPKRLTSWINTAGYVVIIYPEFKLPSQPQSLLDQGVIGIRFHRSRRKNDVFGQGVLMETLPIPSIKWGDELQASSSEDYWHTYESTNDGFTDSNTKFIPTFNWITETSSMTGIKDGTDQTGEGVEEQGRAIEPFRFNFDPNLFGNLEQKHEYWFNKKHAFISPEFVVNKIKSGRRFNGTDFHIDVLGASNFIGGFATKRVEPSDNSLTKDSYFSVIKQNFYVSVDVNPVDAALDWVEKDNIGFTENRFSSGAQFQVRGSSDVGREQRFIPSQHLNKNYAGYCNHNYDDYVGVTVETSLSFPNPPTTNVTNVSGRFLDNNTTDLYNNGQSVGFSRLVNIYREGGPRATTTLFDLYRPEAESFKPITNKLYFNVAIAEENGAKTNENGEFNTVTSNLNTNGRLEGFAGDCYIGLTHRRMFRSKYDRTIVDDVYQRNINVGYTIAFIAESNYNVAARDENIFAITEEATRSFYPFAAKKNEIGDTQGINNSFRQLRLPETEEYNSSANKVTNDKDYIVLSSTVPFIQNNFNTRISFTNNYIQSSFNNQYRIFNLLASQDYSQELGPITALRTSGNNLLCVHSFGITIIPVSERIGGIGDSSGSVFFDDIKVLAEPKHIGYLSDVYGSTWRDSVIESDNGVYGVDTNSGKIWRVSGNKVELLSDFKVQSTLRQLFKKFQDTQPSVIHNQIRTYFDTFKNSMIFTFNSSKFIGEEEVEVPFQCPVFTIESNQIIISGGNPGGTEIIDVLEPDPITLVYNELPTNQWESYKSWYPANMFTIHDNLYSFNIFDTTKLYEHYVGPFTYYYDEQQYFIIEFVANSGSMFHQIFNNLMVISNHVYPESIQYTTDERTVTQIIRPRNIVDVGSKPFEQEPINDIFNHNAVYYQDHLYVSAYNEMDDNSLINGINRRIRDKYCKIRIKYRPESALIIQAIITKIEQSPTHH